MQANEKLGFKADCRDYNMPVEILRALKVKSVRLFRTILIRSPHSRRAASPLLSEYPAKLNPRLTRRSTSKPSARRWEHLFSTRFP